MITPDVNISEKIYKMFPYKHEYIVDNQKYLKLAKTVDDMYNYFKMLEDKVKKMHEDCKFIVSTHNQFKKTNCHSIKIIKNGEFINKINLEIKKTLIVDVDDYNAFYVDLITNHKLKKKLKAFSLKCYYEAPGVINLFWMPHLELNKNIAINENICELSHTFVTNMNLFKKNNEDYIKKIGETEFEKCYIEINENYLKDASNGQKFNVVNDIEKDVHFYSICFFI